jgi:hypothetical protein
MTATTTKTARPVESAKATTPAPARRDGKRIGREVGTLAVNMYERGVADFVAFEKDAAKITPYPWVRSALTVSAGLIEDVGAAYVKTARQVLK